MNDNNIWLEYIKNIKKIQNYKKRVISSAQTIQNNKSNSIINHLSSRIDLHGLTQDQAFENLRNFLHNAFINNRRELLIITGKGQPDKPGVIKLAVPRWLQYTELKEYVLSYTAARDKLGGEGAISVTLKRNKGDSKYD